MKLTKSPKIEKMLFPVLTNLRNTKKKVKNTRGKIQLKYDYINDFVFNDAFDEKKIKYYSMLILTYLTSSVQTSLQIFV